MIKNIKPYSLNAPTFQGKQKLAQNLVTRPLLQTTTPEISTQKRNLLKFYISIKKFFTNIFQPSKAQCIKKASKIVTDDKELQAALKHIITREAIIIQKKQDALTLIRKQYQYIKEQNPASEIFVLNINPQKNKGLPKSNSLISQWFIEENNLQNNLITEPTTSDVFNKIERIKGINKHTQTQPITYQETIDALNILDMDNFEESVELLKNKYGNLDKISQMGQELFGSKKKTKNYAQKIALLLQEIIKKQNSTIIIPDDCSLSGASMLCDTVKILDFVYGNPDTIKTKTKFIFSPLILGTKAKTNIEKFINPNTHLDDNFYNEVCATDELKKAFIKIKELIKDGKIQFEIANPHHEAKHFAQTNTFKAIGAKNPELQEKLYDILRCPNEDSTNIYEGFNNCGVLVITPTESFKINGKTYAGKIPTNCVGFMEVIGICLGVLNDAFNPAKKALFTKGTGKGYSHYSQRENLLHPKKLPTPLRITVNEQNGNIEPSDIIQKYYIRKFKNFINKIFPILKNKDIQ